MVENARCRTIRYVNAPLAELHGAKAAFVRNMCEFQLLKPNSINLVSLHVSVTGPIYSERKYQEAQDYGDLLFTFGMEIYPAHRALHLVEADVVEPFKASAHDFAHTVVWYQERLLPTHEDVLPLRSVLVMKIWLLSLFGERAPGGETAPMLHVCFVCSAPGRVTRLEGVFGTDDLAFKIGYQGWMIFSQSWRG